MSKLILPYESNKTKIIQAIDLIADPVRQTISPQGSNVVFDNGLESAFVTNDGATIVKQIEVEDELQNTVIRLIKQASLQTNTEAGDGTSTTVLLTSVLAKDGLKLVDQGYSRREITDYYNEFGDRMEKALEDHKKLVKSDKDLEFIATISANNDKQIAKDTVKIVKALGEYGQLVLDRSYSGKTEILEDAGFVLKSGMFGPEFSNVTGGTFANYENVNVLVTDKKLYHQREAEKILLLCQENDISDIVIIAKDFTGDALKMFQHNHSKKNFNILLIKDPSDEKDFLDDLAMYLGGKKFSDSTGSIETLTHKDFAKAKRVISDDQKTTIVRKEAVNIELTQRISNIKSQLDKIKDKESSDYKKLENRASLLTNGIVTVKAGGRTMAEIKEKIYRYEDAVNATRVAKKNGYLVGGGLAVFRAFQDIEKKFTELEYRSVFMKACSANIRQIAENSGKNPNEIITKVKGSDNPNFGYNSLNDKFEDLLKKGVIDPFDVTISSIKNAISIANVIISTRNYIIEKNEQRENEN